MLTLSACSEESALTVDGLGTDRGLSDLWSGSDGADLGVYPRCEPGATLLSRIDPARMLVDLKALVALKQRRNHAGQTQAADYLEGQLKKTPGLNYTRHTYSYQGQPYSNLEASVVGEEADRWIMIGAHYDSNSKDPLLAPGADDNASGTAAVLEVARAMAGCRPKTSVAFLFFSNEEKGIIGSKAYVAGLKQRVPKEKLTGFISVDMVAYGPDTEDLDLATKPPHAAFVHSMAQSVEGWTSLKVKKLISDHCG